MRSIWRMEKTMRATVPTAHAIGVIQPTSWPAANPTVQSRIEVGRYGLTLNGRSPARVGTRNRIPRETARIAGTLGRTDPAARPTAAQNVTAATMASPTIAIGAKATDP